MKKIYYSIFILSILYSNGVLSSNQIKYVYNTYRTFIERIDFYDTESDILVSSFNVFSNSPYEKLDFFSDKKNDQGGKMYLASENTEFNSALFKKNEPPYFTQNLAPIRVESYAYIHTNAKKNPSVIYALVTFNSRGQPISWKSSIYVLDNNGIVKIIFPDLDIDARESVVTDNGKLLAFAYGGSVADDMDYLFTAGFQVFDLDKGTIIEDYHAEEVTIYSPIVIENKLFIESSIGYNPESVFYYKVYDSVDRIKWTKKFTYEERNSLFEILDNGLKFKMRGEDKIVLFEKDFESSSFE